MRRKENYPWPFCFIFAFCIIISTLFLIAGCGDNGKGNREHDHRLVLNDGCVWVNQVNNRVWIFEADGNVYRESTKWQGEKDLMGEWYTSGNTLFVDTEIEGGFYIGLFTSAYSVNDSVLILIEPGLSAVSYIKTCP
ncbi:MAG: hypothetical protein LBI42_04010 [Chitinispirillales bacterium]|jgi:hypothetical protein|nr:hypothetical protein [Chitinispirillales bacterium]